MSDTFTINLRGVPLQLSQAQIEADSPGSNLFAASLLGDFIEASNRTLQLDRHPGIFKIILDHLSGYRIFPLDQEMIDEYCNGDGMSINRALRYLQDDSEYYGLSRLNALVTEEIDRLEDEKEDHQAELIALKRYKLDLERLRLQLDLEKANKKIIQGINNQRMQILQTKLNVTAQRLQAAATWAASRQVGSSDYGVSSLFHPGNYCTASTSLPEYMPCNLKLTLVYVCPPPRRKSERN
jgi:hypothetical protein